MMKKVLNERERKVKKNRRDGERRNVERYVRV